VSSLERDGDVFTINLGDGENRFDGEFLDVFERCLDEVEAAAPCALVTAAEGKFWSNGLDLEWLAAQGERAGEFVQRVHELFARVLELGAPSVAALQGHTFAAGAMLALAHDVRVMRADRGFFCLPEVDIRIPFTPGMSALIGARLAPAAAHAAMTTGRRYGGTDAARAGLVDDAVPEHNVLARARSIAAELAGKDPATLRAIKRGLHRDTLAALRAPQVLPAV
jgi:Delta3-Delta2-enoyl-CoA isomerase